MKPSIQNKELDCAINVWCECGDWNICFQVASSYERRDNPNRLAITKWLLAQWKEIKTKYAGKTLYAEAYDDDGQASYREKLYKKLGFTHEADYMYIDL